MHRSIIAFWSQVLDVYRRRTSRANATMAWRRSETSNESRPSIINHALSRRPVLVSRLQPMCYAPRRHGGATGNAPASSRVEGLRFRPRPADGRCESMTKRLLLPALAGLGLAGCVAYPAPPPPPVYVEPPPRRQRVWVPRRCDAYGRCSGGRWVWR